MKIFNKFLLASLLLLAFPASADIELDGNIKIASVYLGQTNDGGWTEAHDIARKRLEKHLGTEIAYTENVPEITESVRRVIDEYVNRGYNIIVGTSFGFGEAFLEASKDYPEVAFLNAGGITNSRNLESFYIRTYQGWYLAGMIAAAKSKSGKLGILAGYPLGRVIWDINAFARGAQKINPDIEVFAELANTWYDAEKEGRISAEFLGRGADVVATALSAASALVAAERQRKMSIGFQIDMSSHAPDGHLASVVLNWETYLLETIDSILGGSWEPSNWIALAGVDIGAVGLAGVAEDLPEEVNMKVQNALEQMKNGTLTPFDGPMYKQNGDLIVDAGDSPNDRELWEMNYFVQGVVGSIPKMDSVSDSK